MDKQIISELENAAIIIMAAPNLVTSEQRRAASTIFLNFRKTKLPYNICTAILETSPNDYVKFEAAETLKAAVIREWSFLKEEDIIVLRDYLMHFVCNTTVPSFVQERLLQVIAIIVKRASVEDFGVSRGHILNDVQNLIINNSDTDKQILGCKIIINIMQEYSITTKSTDVGLPLEVHKKAKVQFEGTDLKRIFRFCVAVLSEVVKNDPPYAPNVAKLMKYVLDISENILTWSRYYREATLFGKPPALNLGVSWREIILAPVFLPQVFQVYWKVRDIEDLSVHAMACLVQLSSLNGMILLANEKRLEYISVYMENFLKLITSVTIKSKESVGVATIILNLQLHFANDTLRLSTGLQTSYFDEITRLTCSFIEGSTLEESTPNGNYLVAFETMFEAWTLMIEEYKGQTDIYKQSAVRIFNTYLEFHLAPPDGRRPREDNEIEEDEDNDRIKYRDHLQAIGLFGREVLEHSLPMLLKLLEARITKLGGRLNAMLQQAMTYNESIELDNLFEDLHWLILIAGHTLCMDSEGETPLIPSEVMIYSIRQCNKGEANLESTLKTMASVHQPGSHVECLDKCDQAIRIFTNVLYLCTMERQANENNLGAFMSPEVGCTLMWFLKRWCLSYLLPTETYYEEFSPTIIGSLGKDTEGATFVTNFLLEKIQSNIYFCKDEAILLQDTVDIFSEVVGMKDKSYIVKTEGLWNLIKLQGTIPPGILPQNVRRGLYKGFVLVGSCLTNENEIADYYKQVLKPVEQKLKEMLCQENFNRIYHEESVKIELIDILEKLIGICNGSTNRTASLVFDFLAPILSELPVLLGMYHNYQVIVELILQLFGKCAKHMLCHFDSNNSRRLYESTYIAVQTYAKYNENRFSLDTTSEEDSYEDLNLLLDLLSFVLCKDWLDLGALNTAEENPLKASDVALYGLRYLMPLITLDLLKYPKLCLQYYRLLVLLSDMYPDKVVTLNDEMLTKVLSSIELGITKFHSDVVHVCLDFLEAMAMHVYQNQMTNTKIYQLLMPFLNLLMDLTLTEQINSDLIPSVSTCVYSLICCYPDQFQMLAQRIIHSQSDEMVASRLASEFNSLTSGIQCTPMQKIDFRRQFNKFVASVHGFLLIK